MFVTQRVRGVTRSLDLCKGVHRGVLSGVTDGDTRSLDHSS